jgi:tRNA A-37 threonylcarbamoyl transferase component Bud32
MGAVMNRPAPAPDDLAGPRPLADVGPMPVMDWERFYRSYRKPGYVPGYEIINKLGGGVFGIVYKARKESIGKFYAIKFLKLDDESIRDAVVRELETIKLLAQIDHPHLVSIEDKGEVDGIPYIIMGYAGEETLKKRLAEGRMAEEEAVRVFVQAARGVLALHERSMIHFDLKPANIFLRGDVARVGDYGLSKLVSESRKTLSMGRGTPYYMAPEMLKRHGDHRSDVYSLGVILYEMLAGQLPFTGESEWEVLRKHETEPLTFPEDFPVRYRALLKRALAKSPDDRYPTLAAMLRDLDAPGSLGESVVFSRPSERILPPPLPRPRDRSADRAAAREKVERVVGKAFDAVGGALDQVGRAAPRVQAVVTRAGEQASRAVARLTRAAEARFEDLHQAWRERLVPPPSPESLPGIPVSAPPPAHRRGPAARLVVGLLRLPVLLLLFSARAVLFPLRMVAKCLAWTLRNLLFLPVRIVRSVFSMTTYLVGAALFALAAIVLLEMLRVP